jgi:cardiolipin synthase
MQETLSFTKDGIERIYGSHFVKGNSVELLTRGRAAFRRIFDATWEAQEIICLQFYIFRNDETGRSLANILKEKAREGVRVYLMHDHLGSLWTPGKFWNDLKEAGVNVMASHPFKLSTPGKYLYRDHRKLLLIDGKVAFTGGLNIGNEYRGRLIKRKKAWRDTGILVRGPVASSLLEIFKKAWTAMGGNPIHYDAHPYEKSGDLMLIPIFSHSSKGRRRLRRLLYYSINHSRHSIYLTTAYFIPSRRMIQTLEAAVKRGVKVKLLVPGKSDVAVAHYAGRAFFTRLLKAGIEIYNYSGRMLHAKSYVFDGLWSVVGSANLDFRSLRWNDEGNVGILNPGFAEHMTNTFHDDLTNSEIISLAQWARRPLYDKIKEVVFSLARRRL